MAQVVRVAAVQAFGGGEKQDVINRQIGLIESAVADGAKVVGLQELCNSPYFCSVQDPALFAWAEPDDGPTVTRMREVARRLDVVLVVPFYEKAGPGLYFNTAIVVDRDGSIAGKYRKVHIPHLPQYWEKYFFAPGDLGFPVFQTSVARIGIMICYDRHFPEVGRALGLNGAEIVFNPSATSDYSRYLWEIEQPAQAAANGFFLVAINRIGVETAFSTEHFFGSSYICDPRARILARAPDDKDAFIVADADLAVIDEVKEQWQFYRDRRPDAYGPLLRLS